MPKMLKSNLIKKEIKETWSYPNRILLDYGACACLGQGACRYPHENPISRGAHTLTW